MASTSDERGRLGKMTCAEKLDRTKKARMQQNLDVEQQTFHLAFSVGQHFDA